MLNTLSQTNHQRHERFGLLSLIIPQWLVSFSGACRQILVEIKLMITENSLIACLIVGGETGIFFIVLGCLLFIPGFYYTRIAYYAYKGYKGFSFSNIPSV